MHTWLRHILLPLAVFLCLASPSVAEPQTLSPEELRDSARRAFDLGKFDVAFQAARALLQRDPNDSLALSLMSQLQRLTGLMPEARHSARQAWAQAETDIEKYQAAMARAQVLASANNRTMAQFWLRRAAEHAPTRGHAAVAREDFRYVRARNRLNLNLQIALSPVSNINNGSKKSTGIFELPLFGVVEAELSGTGRALSGTELLLGVAGRYRVRQSRGNQTDLQLSVSHRAYRLSSAAKSLAPTAEGSDFNFADVQARVLHRGKTAGLNHLPFQLSASLGHTWYGGAPYTRYTDIEAAQSWNSQKQAVRVLAGTRQDRSAVSSAHDAQRTRLELSWMRALGENNNRLTLSLHGQTSVSDDINQDFRETGIGAQWSFGKPILSMDLGLGLNVTNRTYDQGPVSGQDRQDRSTELDVSASLGQLEMYGFRPKVSLFARQTESDFSQYDAEDFGLRLGLHSSF